MDMYGLFKIMIITFSVYSIPDNAVVLSDVILQTIVVISLL